MISSSSDGPNRAPLMPAGCAGAHTQSLRAFRVPLPLVVRSCGAHGVTWMGITLLAHCGLLAGDGCCSTMWNIVLSHGPCYHTSSELSIAMWHQSRPPGIPALPMTHVGRRPSSVSRRPCRPRRRSGFCPMRVRSGPSAPPADELQTALNSAQGTLTPPRTCDIL